jgi:biopolymer transport protein TolR
MDMENRFSQRRYRSKQIKSEINVTPFVDVMLVLLVIFMVTSPMLISGVQVDLPQTSSDPMQGQDEPLAISIDRKGAIYLQDNKTDIKNLTKKLQLILKNKPDGRIFIRGDKAVDYGKVVEVFAVIKNAGYQNVSLITEMAE